jgi:hypothetical protein
MGLKTDRYRIYNGHQPLIVVVSVGKLFLGVADGVLNSAFDLIGSTIVLDVVVADRIANFFLDLPANILGFAFGLVFIRHVISHQVR